VYVAETVALATLEVFVHMRKRRILPTYAIIRCSIPEKAGAQSGVLITDKSH